jgi:hypothetical protein
MLYPGEAVIAKLRKLPDGILFSVPDGAIVPPVPAVAVME